MQAPATPKSQTAPIRPKARVTRRSVLIADRVADWTIRIGGLAIILAVFGIMIFLLQVAIPLFLGASVTGHFQRDIANGAGNPRFVAVDEYNTVGILIGDDGRVSAFHLPTGAALTVNNLDFGGGVATAASRTLDWRDMAFGFADGHVRFARLDPTAGVIAGDSLPPGLTRLANGDSTDGKVVYAAAPGGQYRRIGVGVATDAAQPIAEGAAIVAIDYRVGGTIERPSRAFVTVDSKGVVRLSSAETRMNLLTGAARTTITTATLPPLPVGTQVARVLLTANADQAYVADAGGTVYRYDTRNLNAPVLAETVDLLPRDARLSAFGFLIGEQSLMVAGTDGTVAGYFRLQRESASTGDGYRLIRAHDLEPHAAAVTGFGASQRGKMFVTGTADGLWIRHGTSEQTLLKLSHAESAGGRHVLLSPRDDGVFAFGGDGKVDFWRVSIPHPETTLKTIFGQVWYEGYSEPGYTWQSSAGTDSFEAKLSLIPLIFGTIKGTVYALLFAVPVALLAAIYTSEFLNRRARSVVKPAMEMMASLPSVVLGFIAALILAPIVETWIAAVILAVVVVPLSLLVAAHLWQILPIDWALRLDGVPKLLMIFATVALGVYLATLLGPAFEYVFFAGDFRAWVNGSTGRATPFLFILLFPVSFLAAQLAAERLDLPWLRAIADRTRKDGVVAMLRWLVLLTGSAAIAYGIAEILAALGADLRGGVVGTYVQRNTLIVAFAMGFAVIPIIYTIAEDALNSVPEHLRAASLACGGTPWQTATRVILPTAMSGVFAGIMVGMGRAVGETMIVVMAAGNTPILDWNVFNGLRALSANIAVELPESVKDGTLYRTLFLAALTLFVMTFVINTAAEMIRQRFRKRAFQL